MGLPVIRGLHGDPPDGVDHTSSLFRPRRPRKGRRSRPVAGPDRFDQTARTSRVRVTYRGISNAASDHHDTGDRRDPGMARLQGERRRERLRLHRTDETTDGEDRTEEQRSTAPARRTGDQQARAEHRLDQPEGGRVVEAEHLDDRVLHRAVESAAHDGEQSDDEEHEADHRSDDGVGREAPNARRGRHGNGCHHGLSDDLPDDLSAGRIDDDRGWCHDGARDRFDIGFLADVLWSVDVRHACSFASRSSPIERSGPNRHRRCGGGE